MTPRTRVAAALVASCLGLNSFDAGAEVEKVHLARLTAAAFTCGMWASMKGDKPRMKTLYEDGIRAGRDFLKAFRDNKVTQEDLNKHAPMAVLFLLEGPSDDFIVGRIFEAATNDAFDRIVKQDKNGVTVHASEWTHDDELKATLAQTRYQNANCDHVRY